MRNGCSIFFSNDFYGSGYIDNNLLIRALNENIFYIERNMKRKREDVNVTYLWHCRLDHINESRINKLYKDKFFDPYDYESYETCESYLMKKMTKTLFTGHGERTSDILDLVHTNICGPMSTQTRDGYSYFITFTDDFSRYRFVYLMKHKFEAFDKFLEYQSMVEKLKGIYPISQSILYLLGHCKLTSIFNKGIIFIIRCVFVVL